MIDHDGPRGCLICAPEGKHFRIYVSEDSDAPETKRVVTDTIAFCRQTLATKPCQDAAQEEIER